MISIMRFIHDRKYIHRDIKPGNFCVGQDQYSHKLYVIDYGLSQRYVDKDSGLHIPGLKTQSFVGSVRYASVNITQGMTPSRRDDIESILYMLVEFGTGDLPWSKKINPGGNMAT